MTPAEIVECSSLVFLLLSLLRFEMAKGYKVYLNFAQTRLGIVWKLLNVNLSKFTQFSILHCEIFCSEYIISLFRFKYVAIFTYIVKILNCMKFQNERSSF